MKEYGKRIKKGLRIGLILGGLLVSHGIWASDMKTERVIVEEPKYQNTLIDKGDQLLKINSYERLVKILKENEVITKERGIFRFPNTGNISDSKAETNGMYADASENLDTGSYSITNVQVEGVDEADTLKNDGRYIYQKIGNSKIVIVDTKGMLRTVGTIKAKEDSSISFNNMFLDGNKLIVLGNKVRYGEQTEVKVPQKDNKFYTFVDQQVKTMSILQVYDLSDKSAPKMIREIEVEGDLSKVRKVGQTIYMVTNKYNDYVIEDQFTEEDILPIFRDSLTDDKVATVSLDKLWYQPWGKGRQYTLISAVQLDEERPVEVQALLGYVKEIYMNKESLYLTSYSCGYESEAITYISKYTVDKQKVTYSASGHVKGMLLNQFSMDEYKGNLRIATTNLYENSNAVYVLNNQLKVMGQVENLAPNERIYSVRFTGEKGYIVTFKQVDPLFVIDLSNPEAPKVLGELKIPGFSQYLHPMGEHLVVGIGQSTADIIRRDERGNEVVTGFTTAGIKLSLFDVKDPMNPKEINHIILGTSRSTSGATANHKLVTVHNQRQLLAIPVFIRYDKAADIKDFYGAYVFGVEKGKLVGKAKLGRIDNQYGSYYNSTDRVCYIGDKLYFLYSNKINEYELDTFRRIQTLQLD